MYQNQLDDTLSIVASTSKSEAKIYKQVESLLWRTWNFIKNSWLLWRSTTTVVAVQKSSAKKRTVAMQNKFGQKQLATVVAAVSTWSHAVCWDGSGNGNPGDPKPLEKGKLLYFRSNLTSTGTDGLVHKKCVTLVLSLSLKVSTGVVSDAPTYFSVPVRPLQVIFAWDC